MKHPPTVWTVGHSTRTADEFLGLLEAHEIEAIVDVRRYPASRKHPQFNLANLRDALSQIGIEYVSMPELGGRRRPRPDSHNTAWRNESFREHEQERDSPVYIRGAARARKIVVFKPR